MARSFIDASEWLPGFGPKQVPSSVSLEQVQEVRKGSLLDVVLEVVTPPSVEDFVLVQAANEDAETDAALVPRWRPVIAIEQPQRPAPWPVLDPRLLEQNFAGVTKFSANLAAIKVLKAIESERRTPSDEERRVLNCFTGWGSLPGAFNQEQQDPAWVERSQQLERLLDEQEYLSSRQSVLNSHYTPPAVIQCMWEAVQRLGFRAGRILEPAAGVGYFVGLMPREMIDNVQVTAVEMDQLAGRILKALYRDYGVDVRISPIERCVLPSEWYDLVIGNVPFGDFRLSDPAHRLYSSFSCHNYFIGKSLDLVRPGGLVCLITSSFTLEAWDRSVRAYLSSEAELIAAIRLPCRTFQAIAGTDVQTDILMLRKREYGETPSAAWVAREKAPAMLCQSSYAKDVFCNRYFLDHPEMLIGKLCKRRTAYGEADVAMLETPLRPELARCVEALPDGVYRFKERRDTRSALQVAPEVEPGWRQGSYRIHNARIVRLAGGELVDVHDQIPGTMRSRIAGLIEIRDAVRELLRLQLELGDSQDVGESRAKLGRFYDRFVAKHGFLSSPTNVRAFRGDPDLPLLLSLEVWDEESETAEKAVIFTRNTTRRVTPPERAASPEEALIASLAWRGEVDMAYMAGLLGTDKVSVSAYLTDEGQVFLDPASGKFETADEYLSGNIRMKVAQALVAGVKFARNVAALESVMPPTIDATKIVARLGAVWIPADDVEGFAHHLFGDEEVKVAYSSTAGTWAVKYNDWAIKRNVRATQEFGTSRMHGMELIADALNGQAPTVRDKAPHSERMIVNRAETLAAREKLEAINRAFGIWLFGELMAIFTEVADVQTDEMLSLPKPAVRGGKPQVIVVPNSAALSEFVDGLVRRAERIRGGSVDPSKDNMLAVTNDGRKAALDLRLVGALPTEEHHCKINACVKEVYSIWKETAEERSTQLIFCDLSVPRSQGEFSVYHEIRQKLVTLGVPEQEVRYIHEANTDQQRIKLFREVRSGKVRVLIGSTDRMGVGTNVQERAIALHTLTAPWRPDQMHQADGRVVRPGNRNSEVRLFRYVREGSFDSYIYQLLETKSRFIAQVLSGNKGIRSIEDVQMAALTYAEIKALASGSPLVIEKAAVDAEIAKLSTLFSVWRQQRWSNESEIAVVPAHLERLRQEIRMREQDVEKLQEVSMATFSVSLGGVEIRGAEAAGARLRAIVLSAVQQSKTSSKRIEDVVGSFGGLQLGVREGRFRRDDNPEIFLKGHFEYPAGSYLQGPSIVAGLLDSLKSVASALDRARQRLTEVEQRASDLERELGKPFEHEERLTSLMCRQRELDDLLDLDKSNDGGLEQAA